MEAGGQATAVVVIDDHVVDLSVADPELPRPLADLLELGDAGLGRVRSAVDSGAGRMRLAEVSLTSPTPRPSKFLAVGLNYADHVAESGQSTPEFPTVFAKMPSSVAGPYDDVQRPLISDKLDYEGELGFVIGRRCRHVSRERAHEVIAGYLIFDCFDQVQLLSSVCTLEPGDVVATGTPGGVGIASDRFLVPGDVVRVEIERIGAIENRVIQEVAGEWPTRGDAAVSSLEGPGAPAKAPDR